MKQQYLLALDQGTTSSRAILFDARQRVISVAQHDLTQHYPREGWVEHDPMEIYSTQAGVMVEAVAKSGVDPAQIAAIGITNQRETTVVWDKATGLPIAPAIVWQCRRTAPLCDQLKAAGAGEMIQKKTGLLLDAYFSATKIRWILDSIPGAQARAEAGELLFGTVDSWLIYKLTDGAAHVTDATNASRTMLFNIHTLAWDQELLALFGIPCAMLPEVKSSSEVYGETEILGHRIAIAGIAGDQQAALFGQCCFEKGEAKNTYGTGCFLLMNMGETPCESQNGLITTVAISREGKTQYALEGSVFVGGALVQWLRDELGLISKSSEIGALAASVPDTGGVYLVPAFTGLGAPHWDMYARGCLMGLTRGTGKAQIARAAEEAIAYQVAELVAAMQRDTAVTLQSLNVDGGASQDCFLMQLQADVLGCLVRRPAILETTALGAALLAGLAVGVWPDTDAIKKSRSDDTLFVPSIQPEQRERMLSGWARAVEHSRGWARPTEEKRPPQ